ncbi:uncharacterized protein LOC143347168 [Colletes latitarsis]|uniref:uncharacterized protein LOC143347168 n=1 Tax=Colletes latitarsis TaxID=2605962 RepID=UPI004035FA67
MLFDFLKKIFNWVDVSPKKRKADSLSIEEEFVISKKNRSDYKSVDMDDVSIEIKDDSDSDNVQSISKRIHYPITSSSRIMNGSCNSKGKTYIYYSPQRKREPCCDNLNTSYVGSKNDRAHNGDARQQCPTLTNTTRLKEKRQYDELLQNFLPHRIDVICNKHEKKRPVQEVIEIIDLEKSSTPKPEPISRKHSTMLQMLWNNRYREKRNKEKQDEAIVKYLDNDKMNETVHSIHDETNLLCKKSSNISDIIGIKDEEVSTNTLRDKLATKAIIKDDFVSQTAKRYNARIELRYKEVEELEKLTYVLSKNNRLAREAALEEHLARSMKLCEAVLNESEESEETLHILTEEMLQNVKHALIPRPPDEVLIEGFGLRITRKDIHTLADLNWLNDEVINFYMNLLIDRSTNNKYPKVHAMNTFFYPKLISGGHSSLKRWTRKIDIFAQDLIVIPIHLGIHWCMSVIDFRDKTIRYYDSMGGNNSKCLLALRQYLEDESLDKKKQTYNTNNWKLECVKTIPHQMNGSDCGVFSCMFAEYICANKKITFTQQDMPYFRNKMVYEILKRKLL